MRWYIEIALKMVKERYASIGKGDFDEGKLSTILQTIDSYFYLCFREYPPITCIFNLLVFLEKWFANANLENVPISAFPELYITAFLVAWKMDDDYSIFVEDVINAGAPFAILKDKNTLITAERLFMNAIKHEFFVQPKFVISIIDKYYGIDKTKQEYSNNLAIVKLENELTSLRAEEAACKADIQKCETKIDSYNEPKVNRNKNDVYYEHISPIKRILNNLYDKSLKNSKIFPTALVKQIKDINSGSDMLAYNVFGIEGGSLIGSRLLDKQRNYFASIEDCEKNMADYLTQNRPSWGTRLFSHFIPFYRDKVKGYETLRQNHSKIQDRLAKARETIYYNNFINNKNAIKQVYKHSCLKKRAEAIGGALELELAALKIKESELPIKIATAKSNLDACLKQPQKLLPELTHFEEVLSAAKMESKSTISSPKLS